MHGVTAAYNEVHQIYHIALAAHEAGSLDRFYCSVFDAPGTWGGRLSRFLGSDIMISRRRPEIPVAKVTEHPWPLLEHRLKVRAKLRTPQDWGVASEKFDRWAAYQLERSDSRVFVGVETCALYCLQAARRKGMATVLDCPGAHPAFVEAVLRRAAEDLELPQPSPIDTRCMARRKKQEFELADVLVVLSEVERRSYLEAGIEASRLILTPLWADPSLWFPNPSPEQPAPHQKLEVLFVGGIRLQKGVPYLLEAARQCATEVRLTMVGHNIGDIDSVLEQHTSTFVHVPPHSKARLREMYWNADVLVLPSLCDTFGFVAMEAMACGTPVIVSKNCGVPVPDEAWRVPIMDAQAITERLMFYARNREACREDGRRAAIFAHQWTPERYRAQIGGLLRGLLV